MQARPKLSEAELEIMEAIWGQAAPVTTGALLAVFADSRAWKSQTVNTFLTRLVEKGMLTVERRGVSNLYTAAVSREAYRGGETRAFLRQVHQGSLSSFIAALGGPEELSAEDVDALRRWLAQR